MYELVKERKKIEEIEEIEEIGDIFSKFNKKMSSPYESRDLTSKSSSPEKAEVLSRTTPSSVLAMQFCARKSPRKSSANQSKASTSITDKKKGNYRKCPFCDEMRHSGSLKSHREKCVKYWKLVKNGTDCGICSKSFGSRSDVYGHLSRSHDQAAQYDALLEHDKQG